MTKTQVDTQLHPAYEELTQLLAKADALRAQSAKLESDALDEQLLEIQLKVRELEENWRDAASGSWKPPAVKSTAQVLKGQAQLTLMLEQVHDILYQLLVLQVPDATAAPPQSQQTLVTYLQQLSSHAQKLTQKEWEVLNGYVSSAVQSLRSMVSSDEKKEAATTASAPEKFALGKAISDGYNYLNSFLKAPVHEPPVVVDPKLNDVEQELKSIREGLKKLRNEFLFIHKQYPNADEEGDSGMPESAKLLHQSLHGRLDSLRSRLHEVDQTYVKDGRFVGDDGSFAPQGQAVLKLVLEECYALLAEIQE